MTRIEIDAANEALKSAEQIEATLKARAVAASKRVAQLKEAARDAAVFAIAENSDELYNPVNAAYEAAKVEARRLILAAVAASREVANAKLHVTDVVHQEHLKRLQRRHALEFGGVVSAAMDDIRNTARVLIEQMDEVQRRALIREMAKSVMLEKGNEQ